MKKIICTDIDGVVVKWQSGLPYFAQKYNLPVDKIIEIISSEQFVSAEELFGTDKDFAIKLLEKYNNSDFIRYLSPYLDALCVINELKDEYDFIAITALGNSVDANLNRRFNLNALFPGAFKDILVCDHSEPKTKLYEEAKSKFDNIVCYVDDLAHHVDEAQSIFGNIPVFYLPRGERDTSPDNGICVDSWYDIKSAIRKQND